MAQQEVLQHGADARRGSGQNNIAQCVKGTTGRPGDEEVTAECVAWREGLGSRGAAVASARLGLLL